MPRIEDIESFNQDLILTGKEPEIAKARGEEIEPVLSPEDYPMDHNGPLTKVRKAPANVPEGKEPAPDTAASNPAESSFDDLFEMPHQDDDAEDTSNAASGSSFDDLFDNDILSGIQASQSESALPDDFDLTQDIDEIQSTLPSDTETDMASKSIDDFNLDDPFKELAEDPLDEIATPLMEPIEADESDSSGSENTDMDAFLDSFETSISNEASATADDVDPLSDIAVAAADEDNLDFLSDTTNATFARTDDAIPDDLMADFGDFGDLDADAAATVAAELPVSDMGDFDSLNLPGDESFSLPDEDANLAEALPDTANNISTEESALPEFDAGSMDGSDDIPSMPDFATDLGSDFGTDDFPEEFSMDDFGKQFGVMDEVPTDTWKPPAIPDQVEEAVEEVRKASTSDEAKDFQLQDADVRKIRESLASMPLNLKTITEEVLGNPSKAFADILPIIQALIRGESPADILPLVSKVHGKKIRIPHGYQKKTGSAFEDEQKSFAYQFRTNILPMIRTVALVSISAFIVGLTVWNYVIVPMLAAWKYEEGITAINNQENATGLQLFKEAYSQWPDNNRFIQYADAFTAMNQLKLAEDKYMELLGDPDPKLLPAQLPEEIKHQYLERYSALMRNDPDGKTRFKRGIDPNHRTGILRFADFLARVLYEHPRAVIYLERLAHSKEFDTDAHLLRGDIYIEWARDAEKPDVAIPADKLLSVTEIYTSAPIKAPDNPEQIKRQKQNAQFLAPIYEGARLDYAMVIEKVGATDLLLSKMLRYFMRTGNTREVDRIRNELLGRIDIKPDPAAIAELAGVLIDKSQGSLKLIDMARQLTTRTLDSGATDPDLYYQLSRIEQFSSDTQKEDNLLNSSILAYKQLEAKRRFSRFELQNYLDAQIRKGITSLTLNKVLDAREHLEEAARRYEQARSSTIIPAPAATFGRVYRYLGDIAYYEDADYLEAKALYEQAVRNQYGMDPAGDRVVFNRPHPSMEELWASFQDISYKRGYIAYHLAINSPPNSVNSSELLQDSLKHFLNAQGKTTSENMNLRYAMANASAETGNYESAIALYRQIYEQLQRHRKELTPYDPKQKVIHADNLELRIRTSNNLGVSLIKLARNGGQYANDLASQGRFYLSEANELVQNVNRDPESQVRSLSVPLPFHNMSAALSPLPDDDLYMYRQLFKDLQAGTLEEL